MNYTMKLTSRHPFPAEAREAIFPSANEDTFMRADESFEHYKMRMKAWAEFTIPKDCTHLKVYMSGLVTLRASLIAVCKARGITCTALWPRNELRREYLKKGKDIPMELATNPASYRKQTLTSV